MKQVFISGSISLKKLPAEVRASIDRIIKNGFNIIVGDAKGIDALVQQHCQHSNYYQVTVYSIYSTPRTLIDRRFKTKEIIPNTDAKRERERQKEKDRAMSQDSDYSLVVWDGISAGSLSNITRALTLGHKVKVFLSSKGEFLESTTVTSRNIERIYREHNGYSAAEVVTALHETGKDYFKNTRAFNKKLLDLKVIEKVDNIYSPTAPYKHLLQIETYKGKAKGVRYRIEFIEWISEWITDNQTSQQKLL